MANVIRHGGEAHMVRPDGVYRTSVLTPIMGYQPGTDVQSVLHSFAMGPQGLTQLGSPGLGGFMGRLILRVRGAIAARKARKFMFQGLGCPQGAPGPAPSVATQIAPQMQAQMSMLSHLTAQRNAGSMRAAVGDAATTLARRRPYTFYYAG